MEIGCNTTLDHRVPKHKGGSDCLSNLQWIYRDENIDLNIMKSYSNEDYFLKFCKLITENNEQHRFKNLAT